MKLENTAGVSPGLHAGGDRGFHPSLNSERLFRPFLAPLLGNRRVSLILVAAAAIQVLITLWGLSGWICPIRSSLGVPCPGCGLSTALSQLVQGRLWDAMNSHAFAPFFLFGFGVMTVVSLLPRPAHGRAVRRIAKLEEDTALFPFLLISILIYWILRLLPVP